MSSEPTSFFSLPGELRNEIYKLALVQPHPVSIDARVVTPRILDSPSTSTSRVLALLLANKQIYSEARTIFYHDNSFRILTNGFNPVPNRPARADDKDETQFKQSNFDVYSKFQRLYYQNIEPMILCGHLWPATFQAWLQQIGPNAVYIRNLEFDMAHMIPLKVFLPWWRILDFELRLRMLRRSIAASLAQLARKFVEQGCRCTATITLVKKCRRKPLRIWINLTHSQGPGESLQSIVARYTVVQCQIQCWFVIGQMLNLF